MRLYSSVLATVVEKVECAIHWIDSHYPVDNGIGFLNTYLAPVVQTLDSAIHRINHYPADSVIDFRNTYWLDSDLSRG